MDSPPFTFFKLLKKIWTKNKNKNGVGAFIRIGREIQCLPYAGYLFFFSDKVLKQVGGGSFINGATLLVSWFVAS